MGTDIEAAANAEVRRTGRAADAPPPAGLDAGVSWLLISR